MADNKNDINQETAVAENPVDTESGLEDNNAPTSEEPREEAKVIEAEKEEDPEFLRALIQELESQLLKSELNRLDHS